MAIAAARMHGIMGKRKRERPQTNMKENAAA
jgi:hypothetical protein